MLRIEFDGFGAIRDSTVEVALIGTGQAPIAVGQVIPRIECDGLGVVGNGAAEVAFLRSGVTAIGVCVGRCLVINSPTTVAVNVLLAAVVLRKVARDPLRGVGRLHANVWGRRT